MIKITIYIIFIYIIILLISFIYKKKEGHKKETFSEDNDKTDWLDELFDSRQIITIPDRISHVDEFCRSFNIRKTIFNAILKKNITYNNPYNLKLGEIACALSQESVLKQFIKDNTRHLLLMEDDNIPFSHKFYLELGIQLEYIKQYMTNAVKSLPPDWDVIYFGRCWDDCDKHIPINDYLVKTRRTLCHHAIGFSRKGALIILNAIKHPLNVPIDHIVANLTMYGKINVYATILPLFYQNRVEMSSTIGNYDHLPICM
jgi:GR25 family glycosyltransferase involved in LPS biosynthesis